ncbi:hypothetical protein [uncultured Desulfovibrio sp.]|uniref:hypothetical protein n=1 Tax=uncultured Desulfovibrio sp. TaxID=167968 RepID=UPI002629AB94|nr:hypothetical protein [uncultured Desulfovibrio sp.]
MTVDEWKKQKAEILKAFYNNLWTKAIEANNGIITYLDMVKIADIMRYEAPSILDGQKLPNIIDDNLQFAIKILDLNIISSREHMKKLFLLVSCFFGVAVIVASLGLMLNAGIFSQLWAWAFGGVAGGISGPLGVVGGLAICIIIIWKLQSKRTPQQMAIRCHTIVTKAINEWAKDDNKCSKSITS